MLKRVRAVGVAIAVALPFLVWPASAHAADFGSGDVVIYRVGDGSAAPTSAGTAVFLDEYSSTGTPVQSVALPTTAAGSNHRLVASGTATSEGLLTLSTNGLYLVATGYDASLGTASVASSASAAVPRVVGRVSGSASVDTSTALTDFASGNNIRSAASVDGSQFWVAGAAGSLKLAALGATTSSALTNSNLRQVSIFNQQLYVSSSSGSIRLATIDGGTPAGLPTSNVPATSVTNLPGFPTTGSQYSFALFDLDPTVSGLDTVYVADDGASTAVAGIYKYSLLGGTWTAEGSITGALLAGVRGLTASATGTTVTIFATNPGALLKLVDTSGAHSTINGAASSIATAGANTAFRGVAFAPTAPATQVPEAPLALALPLGALAVMLGWFAWRRRQASVTSAVA